MNVYGNHAACVPTMKLDNCMGTFYKLSSSVQVQEHKDWDEWVQDAFRSLDSNEDGVICKDEMRVSSIDLDQVWAAVMLPTLYILVQNMLN